MTNSTENDRAEALSTINDLRVQIAEAQEAIAAEVAVARANGATWREIGQALGTSRQNAEKRFGPRSSIWV